MSIWSKIKGSYRPPRKDVGGIFERRRDDDAPPEKSQRTKRRAEEKIMRGRKKPK